ncbi:hypothetical protein L1049_011741 [Liquidambar formosana]|uniref:Uncharacterized protein n=1 Tax=Liquidambar formosana TaxID=63359 RepID=A0AAP0X3A2_LIQFO
MAHVTIIINFLESKRMEDVLVFSQPSWLTHQDHFLKVLASSMGMFSPPKKDGGCDFFSSDIYGGGRILIERQSIMSPVQKMIHIPLYAMQVKCTQKRVLHCYERMKRNIIRKRKRRT